MKNLVKIDDRFFTIKMVENKPVMTEAQPEEIVEHEFENLVLLDEDAVDVSMFQRVIDNARIEMEQEMQKSLKNIVLQVLGFSSYSNGWAINGFNDRKESPVVQLLADKLKGVLAISPLNKDFGLTDLEMKKMRASMKDYFKDQYERTMKDIAYKQAQELAIADMAEAKHELIGDKLKIAARAMVEQAIKKTRY